MTGAAAHGPSVATTPGTPVDVDTERLAVTGP